MQALSGRRIGQRGSHRGSRASRSSSSGSGAQRSDGRMRQSSPSNEAETDASPPSSATRAARPDGDSQSCSKASPLSTVFFRIRRLERRGPRRTRAEPGRRTLVPDQADAVGPAAPSQGAAALPRVRERCRAAPRGGEDQVARGRPDRASRGDRRGAGGQGSPRTPRGPDHRVARTGPRAIDPASQARRAGSVRAAPGRGSPRTR